MHKKIFSSLLMLCLSLNLGAQEVLTFIDSLTSEAVSGVTIYFNDSIAVLSNSEGKAEVENVDRGQLIAKHPLYHPKNLEGNEKEIILNPSYQILDEFTVKSVDDLELYNAVKKQNRERNKKNHQYLKIAYYKQIFYDDSNSSISKMNFSADLYVDLTDLENISIFLDNYKKYENIEGDKSRFYDKSAVSISNEMSFDYLANQLFFPSEKIKEKNHDITSNKADGLTKISILEDPKGGLFNRKKKRKLARNLSFKSSDSTIFSSERLLKLNKRGTKNTKVLMPFINVLVHQADSLNTHNTVISTESELNLQVFGKNASIYGFQYLLVEEVISEKEFSYFQNNKKIINLIDFIKSAENTGGEIKPLIKSTRVDFNQ